MRIISIILLFLLLTSAIAPEVKRLERKEFKVELYKEPYYIHKKKMEIEHLKLEIMIVIREIKNQNTRL